jgi:chromosome segregation ATPase
MAIFAELEDNQKTKAELEELKHQLFRENVRIQAERNQLEKDYDELHRERKEIQNERRQLQREKRQLSIEMNQLRETVEYERKRLKDDEHMLDKKQKIIERSYSLLESDKKQLRDELAKVEQEKINLRKANAAARKEVYATGLFFRGVNNVVALKKRYKELMKIYHPDNSCGDQEILIKINEEYAELKDRFDYVGRQA